MSAVSPLGPGAVPRRERRRLVSKASQAVRRVLRGARTTGQGQAVHMAG